MRAYEVQKRDDGMWEVVKEGGNRASDVEETEEDAVERAKALAKNNKPAEVKVRASRSGSEHKAGQFRKVMVYADDSDVTHFFVQEATAGADGDYEVRREGASRASKTFDTQQSAEAHADAMAKKNRPSEVHVRDVDGGDDHLAGQFRKIDGYSLR